MGVVRQENGRTQSLKSYVMKFLKKKGKLASYSASSLSQLNLIASFSWYHC